MAVHSSLVNRVVSMFGATEAMEKVQRALLRDADISIGMPGLVRAPFIAAEYLRVKRTTLVIAETDDHADRLHLQLSAYLNNEQLILLPALSQTPWTSGASRLAEQAQISQALWALQSDSKKLVVTSVAALMRMVAPPSDNLYKPITCSAGDSLDFNQLIQDLIERGYRRLDVASEEGSFAVRGDIVDIHPPLGASPVRIEFFGDEIEVVKRFIPGSGQVIGEINSVEIYALTPVRLTPEAIKRAVSVLAPLALKDAEIAHHIELLEQGIIFNSVERYLPLLCENPVSAAAYVPLIGQTIIAEPKVLFDCAVKEYAQLEVAAQSAGFKGFAPKRSALEGLYAKPAALDFGKAPRITLLTLMRTEGVEATLKGRRPEVAGSDTKLLAAIKSLVATRHSVVIALPNRRQRDRIIELLVFDGVPLGDGPGLVDIIDTDVVAGFVIPEIRLAVISASDAFPRSSGAKKKRRTIDPTKVTFAFNPGDYVVHSTYGVALLKDITRREVDGVERDYLQLEYAEGDTLYTPIDQLDKISKYVGAEGSTPKITRLGTKSWARATAKARKAAHQLAFDLVNLYARRSQVKGFQYGPDTERQAQMEAAFEYTETPDQLEAIADVKADMESERPMDRLVCGDVGYGKTEVAIRAAFKAVENGKQVMILCPTTILAQQHFTTFEERFRSFGVKVEVLSRFRTAAQQRKALEGFAEGTVKVLVGTHRLLSKDIIPKDLGLLIIDEEQRFGVEHKEQLKNMREHIDVLALSATPIPRTLQMSLAGVRDMSVIDTAPANRHPIRVHVGAWDEEIVSIAIRSELERGGQIYYVSNRVKTIEDAVERVRLAAPEARVGVAHGQMSEHQLEEIMEQFAANEIDVLVATTIIESGIDNPHSNTLIIEDSQRLGLAQLYQLKGRVGRSHVHAYAYFLYPNDTALTSQAVERLMAIAEHDDLGSGIKIAMRDLEIRGAGSLIGGEQSGQLSAVGFDLFASMISEAISEVRGEEATAFPDIRIDLDVAAYLPEEYVPDISQRLLIYRRLAAYTTAEAIAGVRAEVEEAFGALPEPAANLFDLAKIKVLAAEIGAVSVARSGGYVLVKIPQASDDLISEMKLTNALYERRTALFRWKIPYGDTVVKAALTIVGAIVFHSS